MIRHIHSKKIAVVVGAVSAIAISSCTLPPEQAWRKIRTEGLIAYWSFEMGSQHAESHLKYRMPSTITAPTSVPAPSMLARTRVTPTAPGTIDTGRTLTALSIPALPGFVRSPYTTPPRLVDVKGSTPGSMMICPYTQRPFIIPSDFRNASPSTMVATTPPLAPTGPTGPSVGITGPSSPAPKSTSETLPKVTVTDRPTQPVTPPPQVQPKPEPKTKPAPAPSSVASNKPPTSPLTSPTTPSTPPSAEPKPVQEIPYGTAIAGRPGFVNSPFAAKHQLVDVTGLPTGMEVKCPYTGKLFRVPPQEMASSKTPDGPPLASPPDEQPKKK